MTRLSSPPGRGGRGGGCGNAGACRPGSVTARWRPRHLPRLHGLVRFCSWPWPRRSPSLCPPWPRSEVPSPDRVAWSTRPRICRPTVERDLTGQAEDPRGPHRPPAGRGHGPEPAGLPDRGLRLPAWAAPGGSATRTRTTGAILLVAPNDRKVRIEVGYGLEPVLTDALSSVIIQSAILPKFRAGDSLQGGVVAGTDAMVEQLGLPDDRGQGPCRRGSRQPRASRIGLGLSARRRPC